MRVRIRRFGVLRFPAQADLKAAALSSPIVPVPHVAVLWGFTLPSSESSADRRGHLWNTTESRNMPSPFRSALHGWGGPPAPKPAAVGSEEARVVTHTLASVRRSNCTCGLAACSFHEGA